MSDVVTIEALGGEIPTWPTMAIYMRSFRVEFVFIIPDKMVGPNGSLERDIIGRAIFTARHALGHGQHFDYTTERLVPEAATLVRFGRPLFTFDKVGETVIRLKDITPNSGDDE